ncbi:MAG: hypothetical protein AB7V50_06365 [Vampirovibrionia bacterium]
MERIRPTNSFANTFSQNWDMVKKLDEKAKATDALAGSLSDRLKRSAKYRARSEAIQHGTDAMLKNRWDADLFKGNFSKCDKLNDIAQKASIASQATTYESLVNHIKSGKAVNAFDWKGLIKGRAANHVDHVTCITEGSANAIGRFVAMNLAKVLIAYDAIKDAGIAYSNARNKGDNVLTASCKSGFTAVKEVSKSLVSWEVGAFGAALATVMFPALGVVGTIAGGIAVGGLTGYMLEKYAPSPHKEPVYVNTKESNPFVK